MGRGQRKSKKMKKINVKRGAQNEAKILDKNEKNPKIVRKKKKKQNEQKMKRAKKWQKH